MSREFFVKFQSTRIDKFHFSTTLAFQSIKELTEVCKVSYQTSNIALPLGWTANQCRHFRSKWDIKFVFNLISRAISADNEILFQLVSNWYWLLQRPIASTLLDSVHLVWISRVNCQRLFGAKNRKAKLNSSTFHSVSGWTEGSRSTRALSFVFLLASECGKSCQWICLGSRFRKIIHFQISRCVSSFDLTINLGPLRTPEILRLDEFCYVVKNSNIAFLTATNRISQKTFYWSADWQNTSTRRWEM